MKTTNQQKKGRRGFCQKYCCLFRFLAGKGKDEKGMSWSLPLSSTSVFPRSLILTGQHAFAFVELDSGQGLPLRPVALSSSFNTKPKWPSTRCKVTPSVTHGVRYVQLVSFVFLCLPPAANRGVHRLRNMINATTASSPGRHGHVLLDPAVAGVASSPRVPLRRLVSAFLAFLCDWLRRRLPRDAGSPWGAGNVKGDTGWDKGDWKMVRLAHGFLLAVFPLLTTCSQRQARR
jgi:hypothetical protein